MIHRAGNETWRKRKRVGNWVPVITANALGRVWKAVHSHHDGKTEWMWHSDIPGGNRLVWHVHFRLETFLITCDSQQAGVSPLSPATVISSPDNFPTSSPCKVLRISRPFKLVAIWHTSRQEHGIRSNGMATTCHAPLVLLVGFRNRWGLYSDLQPASFVRPSSCAVRCLVQTFYLLDCLHRREASFALVEHYLAVTFVGSLSKKHPRHSRV